MNCWGYVKCRGYMGLSTGKHLRMLIFFQHKIPMTLSVICIVISEAFYKSGAPKIQTSVSGSFQKCSRSG